MKLTADHADGNTIRSFRPGEIIVQDQRIATNVIVSRDQIITDWQPPAISKLSVADFQQILDLQPEIILFGTGSTQHFPNISILTEILQSGVAIEIMETGAACRTFNVLTSEYRKVVAALLVN